MLSTVSLIDPTTLNPSFSESSRIGRPAVIVTRGDQQTAVDQFQQLLSNAKAYRLQMLALSKAAANFGYSLEKIAHSKTAIMDPSNVGNVFFLIHSFSYFAAKIVMNERTTRVLCGVVLTNKYLHSSHISDIISCHMHRIIL